MISAIILAAGESDRMGICKQLLDIDGRTMIERVVETVNNSKVDEIIIVLGNKSDQIREKLNIDEVETVYNPDFQKGMSTSLKAGIKETGEAAEAFLIVLGDQPLLESEVIDKLVKRYKSSQKTIIAPAYQGKRGHPVLLDISLRDELMEIEGDIGARNILQNRKEEVCEIEVETPSVVFDVNTREDLEKLENMKG